MTTQTRNDLIESMDASALAEAVEAQRQELARLRDHEENFAITDAEIDQAIRRRREAEDRLELLQRRHRQAQNRERQAVEESSRKQAEHARRTLPRRLKAHDALGEEIVRLHVEAARKIAQYKAEYTTMIGDWRAYRDHFGGTDIAEPKDLQALHVGLHPLSQFARWISGSADTYRFGNAEVALQRCGLGIQEEI